MVETVRQVSDANRNIPRMFRKEDRAVTAEKALTAEARSLAEKGPSAEFL
jgi:hypothetical protein